MTRIIAVAFFCLAVLFGGAAVAKADPNAFVHDAALFCRWLDSDSTPQGVARAVNEFIVQGMPHQIAVDTMLYGLVYLCPEHQTAVIVAEAVYSGPTALR